MSKFELLQHERELLCLFKEETNRRFRLEKEIKTWCEDKKTQAKYAIDEALRELEKTEKDAQYRYDHECSTAKKRSVKSKTRGNKIFATNNRITNKSRTFFKRIRVI